MLSVQRVRKSYGKTIAVNEVSFEIKSGEILGFLGPNGAGKTTTIKMCCGLLIPDQGNITIENIDLAKAPEAAKRMLGYVPDEPFLYDKLTGHQFLDFVSEIYGVEPADFDQRLSEWVDALDMAGKMDELIGSYSRGMKRKIALMAGMIHNPKVLLLDEPTLGLDAVSAKKSKEIIRNMAKQGTAVLLTTHVMEIAEQICDRIAVISHGRIIAEGTLEDLRNQASQEGTLEDVFFKLTEEATKTEALGGRDGI